MAKNIHNYFIENRPDPPKSINSKVKIDNHRAPTDESIKIYNEMLEKAEKNIIAQFKIPSNIVEGRVVVFKRADIFDTFSIVYQCMINGNDCSGRFDYEMSQDGLKYMAVIQEVFDRVSKKIAAQLMNDIDPHRVIPR